MLVLRLWFRSQICLNLPRVGWLIAIFFTSCSSSYAWSPLWLLQKQHSYEVRQVQRLTPTTPLPFLELRNLSILVGCYHSWDFCTPFGFLVAATRRIERATAPPPRFFHASNHAAARITLSLSLSLSTKLRIQASELNTFQCLKAHLSPLFLVTRPFFCIWGPNTNCKLASK